MRFLPDREEIAVAVLGLGYVGSCVAGTLAEFGANIVGVDNNATLIEELRNGHCRFVEPGLPELLSRWRGTRLYFTTQYSAVRSADVVVVTVGTPIRDNGMLLETQLQSACEELAGHIRPGQLLIFKSTVPPGMTRRMVIPTLERGGLRCGTDFGLAFSPERLSEGNALREMRSLPIVVGGFDADSAAAAQEFWRRLLGVEILPCATLEAAEMAKLADNWWIDHNIAMANELAQLCAALDVDVLDVINAANGIPKGMGHINILLPSVGVGGSCLTKDPWMLWRAAKEHGLTLRTIPMARQVNEAMPKYTLDIIVDELAKLGKSPAGSKVAVLGLAFKNNTGDLRKTPVQPLVALLRDADVTVSVFDPLVTDDDVEKTFGLSHSDNLRDAVRNADCIAALAWHKEFEDVDFAELRPLVADTCAVVDGRAYYSRETIARLKDHGYAYRGIGR